MQMTHIHKSGVKTTCLLAFTLLIGTSPLMMAAQTVHAQASTKPAITIKPARFSYTVEAGQTIKTDCFKTIAPIKTAVQGSHCFVELFLVTPKGRQGTPYASVEVLMGDPSMPNLDTTVNAVLESIEAASKKQAGPKGRPYPGKYASFEGTYTGASKTTLANLNSRTMRWVIPKDPRITVSQVGCAAKDKVAKKPINANYDFVTARTLAMLPNNRYQWVNGKKAEILMAYGREVACDGPYFNTVLKNLRML
jgi:hypothetical protein